MPNSLRAKIDKLKYQGKITEEEHRELVEKLKGHDAELEDKGYEKGYADGVKDGINAME